MPIQSWEISGCPWGWFSPEPFWFSQSYNWPVHVFHPQTMTCVTQAVAWELACSKICSHDTSISELFMHSPTVCWEKFAAVLWYSRHADHGIEQLGPRLFSIWGNIFPSSEMGGFLERCCVLREVPLPFGLRPQTPFLWEAATQTSVAYL